MLKEHKHKREVYFVVDLLASEYGWSIEYIQNLEEAEIRGLIYAICKRKGFSLEKPAEGVEAKMSDLIRLASQLHATPEQIKKLKTGGSIEL